MLVMVLILFEGHAEADIFYINSRTCKVLSEAPFRDPNHHPLEVT
jgi:hypothetical protein